ncbi:MAG: hypothetical protein K0U21_00700 [Proteobacteria bacterium]|nr:hypothetical protein [Pseudomonadota bacterium]
MSNKQFADYQNNDEINLRELWLKLLGGKWIIAIAAAVATLGSVLYTQLVTPIYEGKVLIEIGELISNHVSNSLPIYLDSPTDLAKVVQVKIGVTSFLVKGTTKIIEVSYQSPNVVEIQTKLQAALSYIQTRHAEKTKLYPNIMVSPTQKITPVMVNETPVSPKKNIIIFIGLIFGVIIGVLLSLLFDFFKRESKS